MLLAVDRGGTNAIEFDAKFYRPADDLFFYPNRHPGFLFR
jgi:hypothetical protein